MMGRTNGASRPRMKAVNRSLMVSSSFSSPGILEIMLLMERTILSRKWRIG